jgi:hypothetical protein
MKRIGYSISVILIVSVFTIGMFWYSFTKVKKCNDFGIAFNVIRYEKGIPLVETFWNDFDNRDCYFADTNKRFIDNKFYHKSKVINIDNSINTEYDYYVDSNGQTFVMVSIYENSSYNLDSVYCIKGTLLDGFICNCDSVSSRASK